MRIHNGKLENAFVLEVDLGENPVWEVDYGEVQIYPDSATEVEAMVVDTSIEKDKKGTEEWCYWVHAMDAIKKEQSEECWMKVTVGGKTYSVGASIDGLPVCDFDRATGVLRFPEGEGVNLQEVQPGTKITIKAKIPERDDNYTYAGDPVHYDLPLLKGTKFLCGYDKGGKKNPGGMTLHVDGYPSGEMFVHGFGNLAGHWRGYWTCWTPPGGMGNYGQGVSYKDEHCPGDTGYTVQVWNHMNGGSCARPRYPAFEKEWTFTVKGIVFSQAER